jgi:hypothetical protein
MGTHTLAHAYSPDNVGPGGMEPRLVHQACVLRQNRKLILLLRTILMVLTFEACLQQNGEPVTMGRKYPPAKQLQCSFAGILGPT